MAEKKRTRPSVRLACFCENVLEEQDRVQSLIRIYDRTSVQFVQPIPTDLPDNADAPHRVIFFAILDGVTDWAGERVDFLIQKPFEKKASKQGEIVLDSDPMPQTANVKIPAIINALVPGVYIFELRLKGKRLVQRELTVMHGQEVEQPEPVEPESATIHAADLPGATSDKVSRPRKKK